MKKVFLKTIVYFALLILCIVACKKKPNDFIVTGVISNRVTGQAISNVTILLYDGIPSQTAPLGTVNGKLLSTAESDNNGFFSIQLSSETASQATIDVAKEFYNEVFYIGSESFSEKEITEGGHHLEIELEGIALFVPVLQKNSSEPSVFDQMTFSVFSYDNFEEFIQGWENIKFNGEGPFYVLRQDNIPRIKGDRFLRYKVEWTKDGIWESKIDSVFVPTTGAVFQPTIYY